MITCLNSSWDRVIWAELINKCGLLKLYYVCIKVLFQLVFKKKLKGGHSDQNFKGKIQSKEFLGNIIRYQVLISGQVTTIDSMHEGKEKIYSKNEDVDVFVNPETSQVI